MVTANTFGVLNYPTEVYLNLTSDCNLQCKHCFGNYGKNSYYLEFNIIKRLLLEFQSNVVFLITISGGEPTLHPNFVEILELIQQLKIHYSLITNGIMNEKSLQAIVNNKEFLHSVKVSLDGHTPEINGFIRTNKSGNNEICFYQTLRTISILQKAGIEVIIATVIHKKNRNKLTDLIKLFKEIGIHYWDLSDMSATGRAADYWEEISPGTLNSDINYWTFIKEQCDINSIQVNFIDMPYISYNTNGSDLKFNCPAARSFCDISAQGQVSPCALSRVLLPPDKFQFPSIFDLTLNEIWHHPSFEKFRNESQIGCEGCRNLSVCGRCLPQSYAHFDDPYAPPPFCLKSSINLGLKNVEKYLIRLKE